MLPSKEFVALLLVPILIVLVSTPVLIFDWGHKGPLTPLVTDEVNFSCTCTPFK